MGFLIHLAVPRFRARGVRRWRGGAVGRTASTEGFAGCAGTSLCRSRHGNQASAEGTAAPDPDLQSLLTGLFSTDQETRDSSRQEIVAYRKYDPALVPALLQMNYDNPSLNEGIWNSLFILEQLPDEQFVNHRDILLPYLDWTAGKGYGPSTMERIDALRQRLGG